VIELIIPGWETIKLEHLVCDVNGTLAVDGTLLLGIGRALNNLRDRLQVHLITADTHGQQHLLDRALNIKAVRIHVGNEAEQKADYVRKLGAAGVVAIGQGANDALMLKEAVLGICVQSPEGCAVSALYNADLVVPDIFAALELFEKPMRIIASLRK
jgi:P-type E1-E2 ATPase